MKGTRTGAGAETGGGAKTGKRGGGEEAPVRMMVTTVEDMLSVAAAWSRW